MNTRTAGYFVVVLCDNYDGKTHAVGINCYQKQLHDPMESKILSLNEQSLSLACGEGRTFQKFEIVAELTRYVRYWANTRKRGDANKDIILDSEPEMKKSKS